MSNKFTKSSRQRAWKPASRGGLDKKGEIGQFTCNGVTRGSGGDPTVRDNGVSR